MTGKRFAKRLDCFSVRLIAALVASVIVFNDWAAAQAFDFFGLFGSDDTPPPVSRASIPYTLTVEIAGDDGALKSAVRDASSLYSLRKDAPPDGEALARRAQSDFAPVIDALWGAGYYNAKVTIAIDGAAVAIGSSDIAAFARAAGHQHPQEQFVWVIKGTIRLRIGGEERTIKPQDIAVIPGGVEHEAFFPEDTEVIDFFAPVREDFLTGETPPYMAQR